jgi:hypothetical protein
VIHTNLHLESALALDELNVEVLPWELEMVIEEPDDHGS